MMCFFTFCLDEVWPGGGPPFALSCLVITAITLLFCFIFLARQTARNLNLTHRVLCVPVAQHKNRRRPQIHQCVYNQQPGVERGTFFCSREYLMIIWWIKTQTSTDGKHSYSINIHRVFHLSLFRLQGKLSETPSCSLDLFFTNLNLSIWRYLQFS